MVWCGVICGVVCGVVWCSVVYYVAIKSSTCCINEVTKYSYRDTSFFLSNDESDGWLASPARRSNLDAHKEQSYMNRVSRTVADQQYDLF